MDNKVSGIILAQAPSVSATNQYEDVKNIILNILDEIRTKGILPPPAPIDTQFPNLAEKVIKREMLKLNILRPCPKHILAGYSATSNILSLCDNQRQFNYHNLSLTDKENIVHELYHAYQDAARLLLKSESQLEGPALLLATKYLAHALGIKEDSSANEDKLLKYAAANRSWFLSYNPAQLRNLVEGLVTRKRGIWDREVKAAARAHLYSKTLSQVVYALKDQGVFPLIRDFYDIPFVLDPTQRQVTFTLTKDEVATIFSLFGEAARTSGDPYNLNACVSNLMEYWMAIAKRFEKQLTEIDANFVRPNGIR